MLNSSIVEDDKTNERHPEDTPTRPAIPAIVEEPEAECGEESSKTESDDETPPPPETDPAVTFADLKLIRPVLDALAHAGYTHPTPIQEAVIPPALRGKDVIGQSQTGTGKTAAFMLPFLSRWRPHRLKGPIGLVMTPTRELALQVAKEAEKLAPSKLFRVVPVYGGTGYGTQLRGLERGCDLVVGTPGRMIDHLRRGSMTLEHVRYVVLDEADRMLDIGFRPDIERILNRCPRERQTLLMSATLPEPIMRLVNRYMTEPVFVRMTPEKPTVEKIRQYYMTVDAHKKFELLCKVIEREQPRQCLIFCERKRWADDLYRDLKRVVAKTAVIHGDLPQSQREKIMAAFRTGEIRYLIATDVMSRGIDVEGLSHVINYDLPTDIENYVHRIGRTGRIGRDGIAISFVTPDQGAQLTAIEVMINRLIDKDEIPGEWYTPRRPESIPESIPSLPPPIKRDEFGWGIEDEDEFETDSRDDHAGRGANESAASNSTKDPGATLPAKKPVYGKTRRRYSDRL